MTTISPIRVGLIGLGTVGGGVAEILSRHRTRLSERLGHPISLYRVFDRRPQKLKALKLSSGLAASSWEEVVRDPQVDIVVELIGGETIAKEIILSAIDHRKAVVTANKALLANHGSLIFPLVQQKKTDFCFEAAVGGGIPILRALREGFVANEILSIVAIINGTCNYILTEMTEKGEKFDSTLKRAQELGYAERDPSFDIEGTDSAHKLALLASIAYGVPIHPRQVFVEGIRSITDLDIHYAKSFGFVVKLLAIAKKVKESLEMRVHPCMIPSSNPLANVRGVFNAILLEGDYVGPSLLYGRGAGRNPTASAVVADILEVARNLTHGMAGVVPPLGVPFDGRKKISFRKIEEVESSYYLRFQVIDRPGALAKIAGLLGRYGISISSVYQHKEETGRMVPLVILTHRTQEMKIQKALSQISRLSVVGKKAVLIRIEEF